MTIPDEIFVNPRPGDDIEFGQAIISSVDDSGNLVSAPYIKTDKKGDMTHYIPEEQLLPYPLMDYKCFPSRVVQPGVNVTLTHPTQVLNSDDSLAVDFNNINSYGSSLHTPETMITPVMNPLSAVLTTRGSYTELQLEFDLFDLQHLELHINTTIGGSPTHVLLTRDTSDNWVNQSNSGNLTQTDDFRDNLTVDDIYTSLTLDTPVATTALRLRTWNFSPNAFTLTMLHFLTFQST